MSKQYLCTKCSAPATKPRCEKPTGSLGKWSCGRCGKVAVKPSK